MASMKGQLLDSVMYSVKHMLKLFERIEAQLCHYNVGGDDFLSSDFVQQLLLNIIDVYLAHMYSTELKRSVVESTLERMNGLLQAAEIAPLDIVQFLEMVFTQGRDYAVSQ